MDKGSGLAMCPAAGDDSFDGLNAGINAGRICWAVAGTFCGGKVQGSFAEKRDSCINCDFFKLVQKEEGTANLQTKFLKYIPEDTLSPLLNRLGFRHVKASERFINQGDVSPYAYVIQRGSCLVVAEKDGALHPVRHMGEGDIVGEISILTGEPQYAHVEAQTDMDVWVIDKAEFEHISEKDPEMLDFLTELVADRFDSKRPTADRAVGKFIATDVIGSGAYSIVYRGHHRDLNLDVAIKMLRHNLALNPDFLDGFRNEARIIAGFHHDNIVRVYDIEERYRTVFIIMEMVAGESLKDMIRRLKKIPVKTASHYLTQIGSGLGYAHEKGILHQDVNPSNIFILPEDKVKILDFGLACPVGCADRSIFDGTISYMAPEQIKCNPVDERTDIYALGITAYEMVTGQKPFSDKNVKTVMDRHLHTGVPDPALVIPDLPETFRRFINRACRREPGDRYQNMGQALEDLLIMEESPYPSVKPESNDPIRMLEDEHALIRRFIDILAIAVDKLEVDDTPPVEFFERAVEFARNFADRFHHYKEEHVMFTRLATKREGLLDGSVEALRHQHESGRNFIAGVFSSLEGYTREDDARTTNLFQNVAGYIHLLRLHIHREEQRFFPLVRETFSEHELEDMAALFHDEDRRAGGHTFESYRRAVEEMAAYL